MTAVCTQAGTCGFAVDAGRPCNDGDACTTGDIYRADGSCAGVPAVCQPCNACTGGSCQPIATDPDCPTGCCNGKCCAAGEECVNGSCQSVCLPVRSSCNPFAPQCCQGAACSYEANCLSQQGEARCCHPIGGSCTDRCDCCSNADCVGGTCQLGTGQQCVDASECAGLVPACCNGMCRDLAGDDISNCGACGNVCPSSTVPGEVPVCILGNCATGCAAGYVICNNTCVLLGSDEAHCGACGHACAPGETCCGGCNELCPGTCCNGECRDLLTDRTNCGACGVRCDALCTTPRCPEEDYLLCCEGICRNTFEDTANCGACGVLCDDINHICLQGGCLVCTPDIC